MSYSSLWVMDKEFNGECLMDFGNSWLFSPVSWDILLEKYIPKKTLDEKRSYISESMFDRGLFGKLNGMINNSPTQEDRVLWELGNQNIFFTKDKDFIADCIDQFLITNSEFGRNLGDHIQERYSQVANEIRNLDDGKYPYFIFKNTSCDDNVEYWFTKYDEDEDECTPISLDKVDKFVSEFVVVENGKIANFIDNQEYFSTNL